MTSIRPAYYFNYFSISLPVNTNGNVVERYSYDAWGNRRNPTDWSQADIRTSFITNRGFTGHEHLDKFGLINANARMYEPLTGKFLAPDPFVQAPDYSQSFNRYAYCFNNPLKYTDPSGEIVWAPIIIGAIVGAYIGGSTANGTYNPADWNYKSGKTWGYMLGGAVVGGVSGGLAYSVATSGMAFANTASIVTGSFTNSVGMQIVTGGQTDVSVSFGFGSYNFDTGEFGYLGKKGNSAMQNIGYGLGALANVSDVLAGFKPSEVQLNTEKSDAIGHSALSKVGEKNPHNSLVSVGPNPGGKWIFNPFKFKNGTNNWKNYVNAGKDVWKVNVDGVNLERIANYGANLNTGVNYNLYFSSCVNHTARALTLAGAPAIGIHPFILHSQMVLRSVGFRPMLYSYYLNQ